MQLPSTAWPPTELGPADSGAGEQNDEHPTMVPQLHTNAQPPRNSSIANARKAMATLKDRFDSRKVPTHTRDVQAVIARAMLPSR